MTEKKPTSGSSNQRVCNRVNVQKTLLLELDTGEILRGRTVDMSPRGVLLDLEARPGDGLKDVSGTLFIISDNGQFSSGYPCRVIRQKGISVALEIDKAAAAAFGSDMTRDLLGF